jgi:antitoxin (DNA-binding transcriptional repressor) of toxin-antitoxin stability system
VASVNLTEAKAQLTQLVDKAASGEDVIVCRNGKPLVRSTESDPDECKTRWVYDPHIDPALQFDTGRAQMETLTDDALEAGNEAAMRGALLELKRLQPPYVVVALD